MQSFSRAWILGLLILVTLGFPANMGLANTYAVAESQYRAGDLINAEKSVLGYLKQPTTPVIQSQSLRLLGIIRYSKGDTQGAERSFKEGLSINSNLKINPRDVLDANVIILFEKVRGRVSQATARTSKPNMDRNSDLKYGSGLKAVSRPIRTTIRVLANINGGKVMIDGIYAGDTGYALSVDPGNIKFEVMAQGYQTYKGVAGVRARNETVVRVTMRKIPIPISRGAGTAVGGIQASGARPKPIYGSGSTGFRNPQMEDYNPRSASSSNARRNQAVTNSQGLKGELFDDPVVYKSINSLQVSASVNEFDKDLADVKRRNALRKLAKNQQRLRSRPPVEFRTSPSEQNVIVASQKHSANRPELNGSSVVPGDDLQSHLNADDSLVKSEDSQGFFTPMSKQNRIAKDSVNIRDANIASISDPAYQSSGEDSQSNVMTIFPLGLGQLDQGRYGLGGLLFVIQSGLLVYAFDKSSHADSQEGGLQRFVDLNCSARDVTDERLQTCVNVVDKEYNKVDSLRNQSNYALAGFAVVALGGIIEALNWESPSKLLRTPSTNGGSKRHKTLGLLDSSLNAEDSSSIRLGLTMTPSLQGAKGLGLGIEFRF